MQTITMRTTEQRRALVLNRLGKGELTTAEAAGLLALSDRQVWRRAAFEAHGPAGLVRGNRGRASPRRIEPPIAGRVIELAQGGYAGCNDCHLAELLAEREGVILERVAACLPRLQPALRRSGRRFDAGLAATAAGPAPRPGVLLQVPSPGGPRIR
jgi:hypothetical protein